jgi:hypothetical protein
MHPIPYWKSDRNYFPKNHPDRERHLREIEIGQRLDNRIVASSGDGSYSVLVTRKEVA